MKVHLWTSGVFQHKGGIQKYSEDILRVLTEEESPAENVKVFIKNDRGPAKQCFSGKRMKVIATGKYPPGIRTFIFSLKLFCMGVVQRPGLIIVAHANFSPIAMALKKIFKIRYIVVLYGIEVWGALAKTTKKSISLSDRIVSISNFTQNKIIQQIGREALKLEIIPPSFDERRFTIRQKPLYLLERYLIPKDCHVILTVCRLAGEDRQKGYDEVIDVLSIVKKKTGKCKYIIAGDGPDRRRVEEVIRAKGLGDDVVLAGEVRDAELADHYNLCDLFVMPSGKEGFGIVYLEALACGKPVIASCAGGATEALAGGELGVLVATGDKEELAGRICEILSGRSGHPYIYNREKLREKAIECFGYNVFRDKFLKIVREYAPVTG
ncbi:MAG: glycosyltransferase [Candidatus Omnitrophica bacterium]|nr:glycosyltransferase [Candidatus Omnitrophota bacterium]